MNKSTEFGNVVDEFDIKIESSKQLLLSLDWSNREMYGEWLAQTYFFVKHTIGFLGTQVTKFNLTSESSLVSILEHFREEQGHDKLILNDLRKLNFTVSDFREYPETRAFYQSQYFWIDYRNADAHLGYSLFLEGLASKIGPELFTKITEKQGKDCASFIKVHALADQDHFMEGCAQLKHLSPDVLMWVRENLEQSAAVYEMLVTKIKNKYQGHKLNSKNVA